MTSCKEINAEEKRTKFDVQIECDDEIGRKRIVEMLRNIVSQELTYYLWAKELANLIEKG